ncbi:Uncharacterized conserved protein, DUF302 family [Cohaesibacter marisflavi]|uniref:Uncharacterized conserved protein, DUF302 family n=1 Tax=Cohaesibacter marisflavi TaxID=655353 RepID=A0A1I5IVP6_9HYPH|nr:DUF302 domain-containing protein [Cohaesibacter marisflavi]SFO64645.1 Uncharacterized conserved protein, DUF302 family [Cohaesibacter marisflavi]
MNYTIDKVLAGVTVEEAEPRVREALAAKGFGVLTEINVKETLKKKLGEDVAPYKILGACKPEMAHKAMMAEPKIGAMLPCNVILRTVENGTEVSAIDPLASMSAVENPALMGIATDVKNLLTEVIVDL